MARRKKDIVKYSNTINEIQFTGLTANELNVLFSIFSIIKDKGTEKQIVPFKEFRKMTGIETKDKARFIQEVNTTYKKIMAIVCEIEDDNGIDLFTVVNRVYISKKAEQVEIQANESFIKYFNDLLEQYTIFELKEITELTSKYSKNLYRMLIQFRATGYAYYTIEQIKTGLDIPNSYVSRDISKCINNSIKELNDKDKFEKLKYNAIYDNNKQGNPIKAYEFSFVAKAENIVDGQYYFDLTNNRIVEQKAIKNKKSNFNSFEQRTYTESELEKLIRGEGQD